MCGVSLLSRINKIIIMTVFKILKNIQCQNFFCSATDSQTLAISESPGGLIKIDLLDLLSDFLFQ